MSNGGIVAPQGAAVEGVIANVAVTDSGAEMLELKLTRLTLISGEEVEIETQTVQYPSSPEDPSNEMPAVVVPETKTIVFRLAEDITVPRRDPSEPGAAS